VKSLQDELHAWLRSVNAQMPTPNPNYDPSKPEHTPPPKKQAAAIQIEHHRSTQQLTPTTESVGRFESMIGSVEARLV
jgi:hypothetical protein